MTTYVKPGSPHDQGFLDNSFQRRSYEDEMDGSLRRRVNCLTGLIVVVCIIAVASLALTIMVLMQDKGGDDAGVSEDIKLRLSSLEDMIHSDSDGHQKHMMKTVDGSSHSELGGSSDEDDNDIDQVQHVPNHNNDHSHHQEHKVQHHHNHNKPPPDDDDNSIEGSGDI